MSPGHHLTICFFPALCGPRATLPLSPNYLNFMQTTTIVGVFDCPTSWGYLVVSWCQSVNSLLFSWCFQELVAYEGWQDPCLLSVEMACTQCLYVAKQCKSAFIQNKLNSFLTCSIALSISRLVAPHYPVISSPLRSLIHPTISCWVSQEFSSSHVASVKRD